MIVSLAVDSRKRLVWGHLFFLFATRAYAQAGAAPQSVTESTAPEQKQSVTESTAASQKNPPKGALPDVAVAPPGRAVPTVSDSALESSAKRWFEGGSPSTQGCSVRAMRVLSGRVHVACGLGGLWILQPTETELEVVERRDLGGSVTGFFEQAEQLWAIVERTEARPVNPLSSAAGATLPEDLGPPPDRFPRMNGPSESMARLLGERPASPVQEPVTPEGRVLRVEGRVLTIDLGVSAGVRPGSRIEFSTRARDGGLGDLGDTAIVPLAIGVVRAAGPGRARVLVGLNERVPVDAIARPTKAPTTASTAAPARVSDVWEVSGLVRVFPALDEFGGGFLVDASAGYRFASDLHLEVRVEPFGVATADDGSIATVTAFALANYDTRLFEIGAGLGVQTVNDPDFFETTGSGTVVPQHLRLGAQDGVNLDLSSTAVLFRKRFRFSGFRGSLQIPLTAGGWLLSIRGGGGTAGYAFGELGARVLVSGNGRADSSFLLVSLGGVGLFKSASCDSDFVFCEGEVSYGGPTFGFGVEHRF